MNWNIHKKSFAQAQSMNLLSLIFLQLRAPAMMHHSLRRPGTSLIKNAWRSCCCQLNGYLCESTSPLWSQMVIRNTRQIWPLNGSLFQSQVDLWCGNNSTLNKHSNVNLSGPSSLFLTHCTAYTECNRRFFLRGTEFFVVRPVFLKRVFNDLSRISVITLI